MFIFSGSILVSLLSDCQIEVREEAARTFSGLTQSGFFEVTPQLIVSILSFFFFFSKFPY